MRLKSGAALGKRAFGGGVMAGSYWDEEGQGVVTVGASGRYFTAPTRVQTNVLARIERNVLHFLCKVTPRWVSPDHYTLIGLGGAVLSAVGYALSGWRPGFFLLAGFGIFLNWFGDSLDGSLARYRHIERPRYGYCVDHMIDAINISLVFFGIGLSPLVRTDAALFAAVGSLLITVQVLIANHVEGRFHLGFIRLGPTELRIVLIIFTLVMLLHDPVYVSPFGLRMTTYSVFLWGLGTIFLSVSIHDFVQLGRRLAMAEPPPEQK